MSFILFLNFLPGFSQSSFLDEKISISVKDVTLEQVLKEIKQETNLIFSYNSDILPEDHSVSVSLINVTVRVALIEVFKDAGLDFTEIGEQIIITRKKNIIQPQVPGISQSWRSQTKIITVYDTIITLEHDTLTHIRYDTLKIPMFDTIQVFDTLLTIEKLSFSKSIKYALDFEFSPSKNIKNYPTYPNNIFPESYSLSKLQKRSKWDYSFGVNLNLKYRTWILKSGIAFDKFSEYYDFTQNVQQVSERTIYQPYQWYEEFTDSASSIIIHPVTGLPIDTIWATQDRIVVHSDTTEYTFTDTNYSAINNNLSNRIYFISVPLMVGKKIRINDQINVCPFAGIETGILITKKYYSFENESEEYQLTFVPKSKFSKMVFNYILGIDLEYNLSKRTSLISGIYYKGNLTPVITGDYLITPKFQLLKIKLGLKYLIN